jgi:hydroxymethylbilane synthase
MRKLDGGCQVPIGAYARLDGDTLVMDAIVGSVDGSTILRHHIEGPASDPVALGETMVAELKAMGADEILAAVRAATVDDLLET